MITGPVTVGELLWYSDNGATIKLLEVVSAERQTDLIRVRTPGNLEKPPWHCWEGYLFRDKKEAYQQACKFCEDAIDTNNWRIGELQKQNRMIRRPWNGSRKKPNTKEQQMLKHHQIVQNADVYYYDYETEELVKGYIQDVGDAFHLIAGMEPKSHYGSYQVKATETLYATPEAALTTVLNQSVGQCSGCLEQIKSNSAKLSRYTKRVEHVQELLSELHKKGDSK